MHGRNILYTITLIYISIVYYDVLDHILEYTTWPRESSEDQEEGNCLNLIFVSDSQSHSSALVSIDKNPLDLAVLYNTYALDFYT